MIFQGTDDPATAPPGTIPLDEPLNLPPRPTPAPAPPFPLVACLAPLGAAAAIWMITGSAFALVFGLLSPIIAVASLADGRRSRRKQSARDARQHSRRLASLREIVADRHDRLRQAAHARTPSALTLLSFPEQTGLWAPGGSTVVSLGRGSIASGVHLGGASDPMDERVMRDWAAILTDAPLTTDVARGLGIIGPLALTRALARAVLVQVCFHLPPDAVALTVPPGEAWAWARGLPQHAEGRGDCETGGVAVMRSALAAAGSAGYRLFIGEQAADGAATSEEHRAWSTVSVESATVAADLRGERQPGGAVTGTIFVAPTEAALPRSCSTVVRVQGPQRAVIVRSHAYDPGTRYEPELISAEQALSFAGLLTQRATVAGLLRTTAELPAVVSFAALTGVAAGLTVSVRCEDGASVAGQREALRGLACPVGISGAGTLVLDLVRQGPHAVVGGTTGSGKSELLVTWVAAMAACHSPSDVTFLLVDFKGGAAFGSLAHLPHCVGVITDLDAVQASRALASLSAELRQREKILCAAGVRDIVELSGTAAREQTLPRLVIVVDEFATMLAAFPALHALFVDIAARGRSLGVHLILCTQRPAGIVRDALLANCSLRLSMRVNNRADSAAVIGTDAAAALPASVPGRCFVSTEEGMPVLGQIATTTTADLVALAARTAEAAGLRFQSTGPRRPWRDPLPRVLRETDLRGLPDLLDAVDGGGQEIAGTYSADASFRLGLLDEPERQRYRVARYTPARDGHVLVVGDARSGKTALLATLARHGAESCSIELIGADVEHLWDALVLASRSLESGWIAGSGAVGPLHGRPRLLLIDDVDAVFARWSAEHQLAALDMLSVILRDGPGQGLHVALTLQRVTGALRGLGALCRSRLILSLRDREDYREAGGALGLFDDTLPAGGGYWQGVRIQLLAPAPGGGAAPPDLSVPEAAPVLDLKRMLQSSPLIVVSGAPARTIAVLRRALGPRVQLVDLVGTAGLDSDDAGGPTGAGRLEVRDATAGSVIIGDADAWQSQWTLLTALRGRTSLIFDGCSPAELRLLGHWRGLPPPLLAGPPRVWVLSPDGTLARATLPVGPGTTESGAAGPRLES